MISSHDDFKKNRPTSFRPLHGGLHASASGRWRLGHFERCRLVGARLAAFLWLADSPDGRWHSLRTQPSLDRIVCRSSDHCAGRMALAALSASLAPSYGFGGALSSIRTRCLGRVAV